MAANIRCIMRAKAPYGQGITKMKVKLTPEQSSTPSLMPETNSVYLSRPTEGTGELMELVGGTVAWNQLCNLPSYTGTIQGLDFDYSGQRIKISGTPLVTGQIATVKAFENGTVSGHKYLVLIDDVGSNLQLRRTTEGLMIYGSTIFNASGNDAYMSVRARSTSVAIDYDSGINTIDLTQMLNPTIADYAYSLEQATPGSGIAWLKKYDLIKDGYKAYNAGSLESVNVSAHVTVGFNQWDEEWRNGNYSTSTGAFTASGTFFANKNLIPVFPNTTYCFRVGDNSTFRIFSYSADGSYTGRYWERTANTTFTTDANTHFINFCGLTANYGATYKNDICINISKTTGTPKNGDYMPYVKRTYPTSPVTLRGILMKDADGNLYYDGDTYEWDGTVTRKWGEVKLTGADTEGWSLAATYGSVIRFDSTSIYHIAKNGGACFSNLFPEGAAGAQNKELVDLHGGDGHLIVQVSSSTASTLAAWKTYLSTHNLEVVYELATQTTESADPFTAVQTVEDGGTEEFVTTNGVPVGVIGRFANAVPMEGVDSFTVTADDGTIHTYPVTLGEEIYRGYVDMLTGEAISDMASIAEYNGETINSPWLSSLDVYALGATPTRGAQVVYPITPEEVIATITGDPSTLSGVVSATSTEGTVDWSELSEIGIKCIMKRKNPFQ